MIAIAFATLGEYFASVFMEGYIYRLGTVPAYIPPGHGMVYLTAIALARSGVFQRHARPIALLVLLCGGAWALAGFRGYTEQNDVTGLILYIIFALCVWKGPSPMVYLGAFFMTSWLELIGTFTGIWTWAEIDPASHLPQGNPPSGVAAYYCLVDAVAIGLSKPLLRSFRKLTFRALPKD
jgi:hypothetical protein